MSCYEYRERERERERERDREGGRVFLLLLLFLFFKHYSNFTEHLLYLFKENADYLERHLNHN